MQSWISRAIFMSLLVLGLVACGQGTDLSTLSEPEQLYQNSCVHCHATDLSGLSGPALTEVGQHYGEDEIVSIILNGTGRMGPIRRMNEEQAQIVAQWLIEETSDN